MTLFCNVLSSLNSLFKVLWYTKLQIYFLIRNKIKEEFMRKIEGGLNRSDKLKYVER